MGLQRRWPLQPHQRQQHGPPAATTSGRPGLTADNIFQRFNPTAGVVYKPSALLNAYFDYGESSRAPTSTELGCADPNFPCSLPNALVSDPPLKQVVGAHL